jgi:hypothetical protein
MRRTAASSVVLALLIVACGKAGTVKVPDQPPDAQTLAQLWVDPGPAARDLFWGVGGERYAPPADATWKLKARDDAGFSISFDVTGPDDLEWSAKIGPEAQTEVVVSRVLWGLGYHQPPIYYLPSWQLDMGGGRVRTESEARFRPKLEELDRKKDYWRWADNPFLGARQFRGMLVVLLMFNSTDLKDDNNAIYEVREPWGAAGSRWFMVRDVGASLGRTGKLFPRRNWVAGFEQQGFIKRIDGRRIEFDYTGRHQELLSMITPEDVQWASARLQGLTDEQWRDAFRAGNYADSDTERFLRRIRQKIDNGLALRPDAPVADER